MRYFFIGKLASFAREADVEVEIVTGIQRAHRRRAGPPVHPQLVE